MRALLTPRTSPAIRNKCVLTHQIARSVQTNKQSCCWQCETLKSRSHRSREASGRPNAPVRPTRGCSGVGNLNCRLYRCQDGLQAPAGRTEHKQTQKSMSISISMIDSGLLPALGGLGIRQKGRFQETFVCTANAKEAVSRSLKIDR